MVKREEMKYWEQLTLNYMTEESDDMSDSNTIIEHMQVDTFSRYVAYRYECAFILMVLYRFGRIHFSA